MILITGGAGYIGSHTIIELAEDDHELFSVDNYANSSTKTYERLKEVLHTDVSHEALDLTDAAATDRFFENNTAITGIIHFAAHKAVGESVENPLMYYHNNLSSLVNLLECCKKYNINHFIFSSSCTVYGQPEVIPVTEKTPILPAESPYGNTKQIGEEILQDFCKANPEFKVVALRYFNPVGAHMSGLIGELPIGSPNNLAPFITQTAIGIREKLTVFGNDYNTIDGTCIRDYIHVSDIAKAHVLAINRLQNGNNESSFEVFNLGTGNGCSVLETIQAFEKVTGEKLNYEIGPRRSGDVEAIFSNSAKAKNELGWVTKYSLEDMMSSAWKWEQHLASEN